MSSCRLAVIADIQTALDELFRAAGGVDACTGCDGACCGCGRHHVTLTNVLAYLVAGEDPPAPDFSRSCPYLDAEGCRLPVARRPYNCITFFCEILDSRLDGAARERLHALDAQLRNEYLRVAERYPAAGLRGLWISLGRLGDDQLLRASGQVVVE